MGKIGKPQKSRKHKKLKAVDPFYVGDRKINKDANLINRKPKNDEQEIPGKFRELVQRKDSTNKRKGKRKKSVINNKEQNDFGMTRPIRSTPVFKQRNHESYAKFKNRMDSEVQSVILQSKLEDKYDVEIEHNEDGEIKMIKNKKTNEKNKKRLKEKHEKKKIRKIEKRDDKSSGFEHLQDTVEFGEFVHAPPCITAKPRKSDDHNKKQWASKGLLLAQMMEQDTSSNPKQSSKTSQPNQQKRQIGKTIKTKLLAPAQQIRLAQERTNAIERYRQMKRKKTKPFPQFEGE